MIAGIQNMLIALFVGLVVGGTGAGLLVKNYVTAKWTAAVADQKREATTKLQQATDRAIKSERKLNEISTELEVQSEISKNRIETLYRSNNDLAGQLGGLRDPGRRPSCSCPTAAATNTAVQPAREATGAELSAEASQFLLNFAREADHAAEYAQTCHRWIEKLDVEQKERSRVD